MTNSGHIAKIMINRDILRVNQRLGEVGIWEMSRFGVSWANITIKS